MQNDLFSAKISYTQIIDENGNVDASLFPKDLDDKRIVEMYKYMLFARAFDAKVLSLQRQGRAVTYAPLLGEEATQVGSAMAMGGNDIFVPTFRQHAVFLIRGLPLELMLIYWRGYEEGNRMPKNLRCFPIIVPVATQMPHAVGVAFAQKYKKTGARVVSYVGDGGTSEGDFYEALNFAGVWRVPLVVIIENNQWAISVPRSKQTAASTLAQKAIAAGINAVQVDGNDLVAVYKATRDALASADNGPIVIECVTYRMSLHTTADDPTKYRSDKETLEWQRRDPISRIKAYLMKRGAWNDDLERKTNDEHAKALDDAVARAEAFKEDPKSIFEHVYSYIPETLQDELSDATESNFWR